MVLMSVMKFVSLVQSYHLFCTRAILKNGDRKGKRLTIYLKNREPYEICTMWSTVFMSAFSALPRLYQIVSSKVLYLAHKLQKVPKAKLADSVIVYSKWLGVCMCL